MRSFSLGSARRITALLALLLSALYVTNAWQTLSVGRWHKPGAAIFPIALGALLALLLSVLYVTNAWQTLSVGRWHKPGAAIFPIALGALLAISGLSVLLERRGGGDGPMPAIFTLPAGSDLRRLLLLLAAFALYFLVMPVIGNMIASALFLFASMWLLSDDPGRSLLRLAAYAIAIALCFEWFFVRLLKVQMPGGVFRQWLF